jgi:hypothetical protein
MVSPNMSIARLLSRPSIRRTSSDFVLHSTRLRHLLAKISPKSKRVVARMTFLMIRFFLPHTAEFAGHSDKTLRGEHFIGERKPIVERGRGR